MKEDVFMEQSPELGTEHVNFTLKKQQQQKTQANVRSYHFSRKMLARAAAQDVKPQKMI